MTAGVRTRRRVAPARGATATMPARWYSLWLRLGARSVPDLAPVLACWREPQRRYHGEGHLRHCLATYDRNPLHDDRVELALWLHDAVYDPHAHDNEERSAAVARELAEPAGLGPATVAGVCACILATRHRAVPASPSEALTLDVDLAILGETRRRFVRYDDAIRDEYAWVPEADFRHQRARVLSGFLDRLRLFRTAWFHRRYERPARRNLRWAIARLNGPPQGAEKAPCGG